jgi:hypothetical protein
MSMSAIRRSELVVRRLRTATVIPRRAAAASTNVGALESLRVLRRQPAVCDVAHTAGRLDACRRVPLGGLDGWDSAGALDAVCDGPWVVLRRGSGERRRERCALEARTRNGAINIRLRLTSAVTRWLSVGAGDLVVVYADPDGQRLWVTSPAVLAAAVGDGPEAAP